MICGAFVDWGSKDMEIQRDWYLSHGANRGSNPRGDAINKIRDLTLSAEKLGDLGSLLIPTHPYSQSLNEARFRGALCGEFVERPTG